MSITENDNRLLNEFISTLTWEELCLEMTNFSKVTNIFQLRLMYIDEANRYWNSLDELLNAERVFLDERGHHAILGLKIHAGQHRGARFAMIDEEFKGGV